MTEKRCGRCRQLKAVDCFYSDSRSADGLRYKCKECCSKDAAAQYEKSDRADLSERKKQYYRANKEASLKYRIENKESIRDYMRGYQNRRLREDVQFRLRVLLRNRIRKIVKGSRVGSAIKDLGCTVDQLKRHLESQFQPGMTWSNHGKWHIDHVIPLSKFNLSNREDFRQACHYTNLQPLWALDNLQKGAKV